MLYTKTKLKLQFYDKQLDEKNRNALSSQSKRELKLVIMRKQICEKIRHFILFLSFLCFFFSISFLKNMAIYISMYRNPAIRRNHSMYGIYERETSFFSH